MRVCIVVDTADSVFAYNYAKWLKIKEPNISVSAIEMVGSKTSDGANHFDEILTIIPRKGNRYVNYLKRNLLFIHQWKLKRTLKGRQFDVVHFQGLLPPDLVSVDIFKKHCQKTCATFWGGEFKVKKMYWSHGLYLLYLSKFLSKIDCVINSAPYLEKLQSKNILGANVRLFSASLGSAPMEALNTLMLSHSKKYSKEVLDCPSDKISVLIGYSGKKLHQHIPIIEVLAKYDNFKGKIHLLLPMTRDATGEYTEKVEDVAKKSGYSYSLLKNKLLSEDEVANLRYATDVVLQLSLYDGFSRSILECMFAKAIVIYGGWLGYDEHLQFYHYEAVKVDCIEGAIPILNDIINNPDKYSCICETNHINIGKKGLWSSCINDWLKSYHTILNDR